MIKVFLFYFNMTGDKPNFIDIEEDRNNKLNQLGI